MELISMACVNSLRFALRKSHHETDSQDFVLNND